MSNLKLWFDKAFKKGKSVQKQEHKGKKVDGRAIWAKIENKLITLKDKNLTDDSSSNLKYNSTLDSLYDIMDVIIEKFGMDKSEFCPKSNHFFMQLKNLVKVKSDFNIQVNRVAQLGFNAGQLSVFIKKETLCEDRRKLIVDLVDKYNMFNINTYVTPTMQSIINTKYLDGTDLDLREKDRDEHIQKGGDLHYVKYMKYKSKYLMLKNKY
jgi:hypothetical protein